MSIGERNPFAANDYGDGVSGAAKYGIEHYQSFSGGNILPGVTTQNQAGSRSSSELSMMGRGGQQAASALDWTKPMFSHKE